MTWIKVVLINLLVFLVLIVFGEVALRTISSIRTCFTSNCDFSRITTLKVRNASLRFDEVLGYVPLEGFDGILNGSYWRNKTLTITEEGYRLNNLNKLPDISEVLVVGDSFTFGEEVSNHETWPACLERKLSKRVDNGGVAGYGAAQALKRALLKLEKKNYSTLVFSVVVGEDFARDRMIYNWGRPRPALIRTDDGIAWSVVSNPKEPGTIFNPFEPNVFVTYFYERFLIFALPADRFWATFHREHPNAADTKTIIEWTLREFSNVEIPKKILLLQYWENLTNPEMLAERQFILKVADELSLEVIDTLDILGKYNQTSLWQSHHTPLGNEIVCEYLFEKGFREPLNK